jgi:hypothetical protein
LVLAPVERAWLFTFEPVEDGCGGVRGLDNAKSMSENGETRT